MSLEKVRDRISQLKGVMAVDLSTGNGEFIDEVHVVASDERSAKRLVRDIETIILIETGCPFDHKKISIAQVGKQDSLVIGERIKINAVYVRPNEPVCNVELECKGEEHVYRYQGDSLDDPNEMIIKGLIKALEEFLQPPFQLRVRDISEFKMKENVVAVILQLKWTHEQLKGEEELVGCSLVKQDLPLALARAFFNAINRRLIYALEV